MDQSEMQKPNVSAQLQSLLGRSQAYAADLSSRAQTQLRERPFVAVAGAIALGFVAGALLGRYAGRK